MSYIKGLVQALEEWEQKNDPKDAEMLYWDLVMNLGYNGETDSNPTVADIENKVVYLISECKMREDFIVRSIINGISSYLNDNEIKRFDRIRKNQEVLNSGKLSGKSKEMIEEKTEELNSSEYSIRLKNQIDTWNIIRETTFTKANIKSWEQKELSNLLKSMPKLRA